MTKTTSYRTWIIATLMGFSLTLLTACQSLPHQADTTSATTSAQHFNIQGKIGIKTPEHTSSAFYQWQQHNEHQYQIELSGMFGIGRTLIIGNDTHVSLTNAQVGDLYAQTPEELLYQATGWTAPISHLRHWIHAHTATQNYEITYDEYQRPSHIQESGWQVQLDYHQRHRLPHRLTLQPIDTTHTHRIILTIQNR